MTSNKHRIRIKPTKRTFDFRASMKHIAEQFMAAERYLTPLIRSKSMPAHEAAVLIGMYGDGLISGNTEHSMTEAQIIEACNAFVSLWRMGLFVPSPDYPYTLQETLEAGEA
jgi:hypothetical protein